MSQVTGAKPVQVQLAEALMRGDLERFAAQAEADGVGPADRLTFDAMAGRVTAPRPAGQRSRSRARGASRGR